MTKCAFHTKGAPHVSVFSDHAALASLHKKELIKVENKPQPKPQPKPTDYIVEWISPVDCPICSYSATLTVTFIWEPFEQTTVEFPVKPCWAHNPEVTKNFGQHPGESNSHSSSSS